MKVAGGERIIPEFVRFFCVFFVPAVFLGNFGLISFFPFFIFPVFFSNLDFCRFFVTVFFYLELFAVFSSAVFFPLARISSF